MMRIPAERRESLGRKGGDIFALAATVIENGAIWTNHSKPHHELHRLREVAAHYRRPVALLHGGFERHEGTVVESFTRCVGNELARVFAFG